jgi:hypothetical protein
MNQLESNTALFYEPNFVCVPTYKYLQGAEGQPDAGAPQGYTHLMVYDSNNDGVTFKKPLRATTVTLFDQFYPYPSGGLTVSLGNPFLLLTPTKKIYKLGKKVAANGHWVFYYFEQPKAVDQTRDYINQLERNTVDVFYPNWLLVPTYKSPSSEHRPLGRLYRGTHSLFPLQRPGT